MASIKPYEKDGKKCYKFQLYVGTDPLTGKPIKTTRRGFKTKKEAELALSRLKLEIERGDFNKKTAETYQDVFDMWIRQYKNTVKESTFAKTKQLFKLHILPAMGKYKINKIKVSICQRHVNDWFGKYSKYREMKSYASKVLDYAISLEMIQNNPMKKITMPKKIEKHDEKKKVNFYSKEELIQFLTCAEKGNNQKAYVLFRLLAFSGMRQGEALNLFWSDLNFKNNEISINRALTRGEGNKLITQTPKTKSSIRTIMMDNKTMEILKEWKRQQRQELLMIGYNTLNPNQLVFSNSKNTPIGPPLIREWMLRIQYENDLKIITPHGLRHTSCTLLVEAGASYKEVQERLGHTNIKTTMDIYAHVTKKAKDSATKKFATYMDF